MESSRLASVFRWSAGKSDRRADELAQEEPLEIRVRGRAISITMRTPGEDPELAAGFLLSEGIVHQPGDVLRIELCGRGEKNLVNVVLDPTVVVDFQRLTRHVFASSSCGVCGKTSIESIQQQFDSIQSDLVVGAEMLLSLPARMRRAQTAFERTGGLHAAAIFDFAGEQVVLCEDVGRHNAVDKVLGHGLLSGKLPFDQHVLLVSGRLSFEIVQKALAGRIPIVAAISAPSSLAVEFAEANGQTLVGFLREGRMNVYAHRKRIRF
jgi:FdhD protein